MAKASTLVVAGRSSVPVLHRQCVLTAPLLGMPAAALALGRAYARIPDARPSAAILARSTSSLAVTDLAGVTWSDGASSERIAGSLRTAAA